MLLLENVHRLDREGVLFLEHVHRERVLLLENVHGESNKVLEVKTSMPGVQCMLDSACRLCFAVVQTSISYTVH